MTILPLFLPEGEKNTIFVYHISMETIQIFAAGRTRTAEITRKRIRRMHMRMGENGDLRISCPLRTPSAEIRRFILSSEKWILKAERNEAEKERRHEDGSTSSEVYWLGEKKTCVYMPGKRDDVKVIGDTIVFTLKEVTPERVTKAFRRYAGEVILGMASGYRGEWDDKICRRYGRPFPEIRTRYMTSRWGVCKVSESRITLSQRLIHYPPEALRAILLHEYVHLLVPNHSAAFYRYVYHFMPEYDIYRKVLNERR